MKGPQGKVERNAEIVRLVQLGINAAQVAREYRVSRERIRQIWTRATGLPVPRLPAKQAIDCASRQTRRMWARAKVTESGCWEWTGARHPTGYGSVSSAYGGYAHRWAYETVKGPIPTGLTIDHLCRNRSCVNPDHLEAVTQRENTLRSPIALAAINAAKTHCPQGHEYTSENTYSSGEHGRQCRTCRLGRVRNRRRTAA